MSTSSVAIFDLHQFGKELASLVPGAGLLDMDDKDLNFLLPTKPDLQELDKLVARALFADPRFRSDMGHYWLLVLTPLQSPRAPASLVVRPVHTSTWVYQKIEPTLHHVRQGIVLSPFLSKEFARLIGHEPTTEELAAVTMHDEGDIVFFAYNGRRFMTADLRNPTQLRCDSWPPMLSQWSMN
jgi:hypothetical protein